MLKYKIHGNNTKIQTNNYIKYFFLDLLDAKVSKTSSNESFLHMSFSIDIIVNTFNLSSICVDLSRFLIRANFENERSASQFVNGIVRYNLNAIYTFGKTSISCRS